MEFRHIKLAQITPNPDNPRKTFDDIGLQELADSIREKGVLQPILVRPWSNFQDPENIQYLLIAGERRYRAAQLAGLTDIPCTVREMSNEEALEIMLMENFQRQDVHPVEEAIGFRALQTMGGYKPAQIAAKVGKSLQYVVSRLKLAGLTPELHRPFFENRFNMKQALALAVLAPEVQKQWFSEQDEDDKDWQDWRVAEGKDNPKISEAPFPTDKKNVVKGVGACIGCQFNTATSDLFPEMATAPRCLNKICFESKSLAGITDLLKDARENNIPVITDYSPSEIIKQAAAGLRMFASYTVSSVEPAELEEIDREDYDDEDEYQEAIQTAQREYEKDLKEYAEASTWPTHEKAIRLKNDLTMTIVYMKKRENESKGVAKSDLRSVKVKEIADKAKKGEATLVEKSLAVDKLREEIARAKDIRDNKVFERAKELFDNVEVQLPDDDTQRVMPDVFFEKSELSDAEMSAAIYVMLDTIGFVNIEKFLNGIFGIKPPNDIADDHDGILNTEEAHQIVLERFKDKNGHIPLKKFDEFNRAYIRWLIDDKISHSSQTGADLFIDVANYHFAEQMDAIRADEDKALDTKVSRYEAQIKQLES